SPPTAIRLPPILAGPLVDGEQVARRLVIAQQDQRVLKQRRRAAVPPLDVERRNLLAEIALPDDLAGHVERDDLTGAEPRVHHLAVGDRTRTGEVVLVVYAGQRPDRLDTVLPQAASLSAREGFDDELGAIVAGDRQRPLARGG